MIDKIEFSLFGGGAYLLAQVALLISYYGLGLPLPWWVVWFPSLLILGAIAAAGLILGTLWAIYTFG